MSLYWLVYRHNNQSFVVIEPGASLIHARMRAALDGLDQGEFTEGHELDRKQDSERDDWAKADASRKRLLTRPGDAGKSSVLDAIDYCLGARRSISFSDADFHRLDVSEPIHMHAGNVVVLAYARTPR
jgi:hypothetical protein